MIMKEQIVLMLVIAAWLKCAKEWKMNNIIILKNQQWNGMRSHMQSWIEEGFDWCI